jgi:hypothetical protein
MMKPGQIDNAWKAHEARIRGIREEQAEFRRQKMLALQREQERIALQREQQRVEMELEFRREWQGRSNQMDFIRNLDCREPTPNRQLGSPTLFNLYEKELEKKAQAMQWELDDEIARLTLNIQPPAYTARPVELPYETQWDPVDQWVHMQGTANRNDERQAASKLVLNPGDRGLQDTAGAGQPPDDDGSSNGRRPLRNDNEDRYNRSRGNVPGRPPENRRHREGMPRPSAGGGGDPPGSSDNDSHDDDGNDDDDRRNRGNSRMPYRDFRNQKDTNKGRGEHAQVSYPCTPHSLLEGYEENSDLRITKAAAANRWPTLELFSTTWTDYKIGVITPLLTAGVPLCIHVVSSKLQAALSMEIARHLHIAKVRLRGLGAVLHALDLLFKKNCL